MKTVCVGDVVSCYYGENICCWPTVGREYSLSQQLNWSAALCTVGNFLYENKRPLRTVQCVFWKCRVLWKNKTGSVKETIFLERCFCRTARGDQNRPLKLPESVLICVVDFCRIFATGSLLCLPLLPDVLNTYLHRLTPNAQEAAVGELITWQHINRMKSLRGELKSCVKVEVAVLGTPSLTVLMVSVDVKKNWTWTVWK